MFMLWLIGCWNIAKHFGIRKSQRTPVQESWTRSLKKPRPAIARGRRPLFREIKRVAEFLEVLQSLAAKCSKDRAQEFRPLAEATQLEISGLQKNQARSLVGAGGVGFPRPGHLGFGSAHTMNMSGYCASFDVNNLSRRFETNLQKAGNITPAWPIPATAAPPFSLPSQSNPN